MTSPVTDPVTTNPTPEALVASPPNNGVIAQLLSFITTARSSPILNPSRVQMPDQTSQARKGMIQVLHQVKSLGKPAECAPLLDRTHVQEVFPFPISNGNKSHKEALLEYREKVMPYLKEGNLNSTHKDTAICMMRGVGLSLAKRVLWNDLPKRRAQEPLSILLQADRNAIKNLSKVEGQGSLAWGISRLSERVGIYDHHKNGDYPYLIGTRELNGKALHVYHLASPMIATGGWVQIAPEFRVLLEAYKSQNEKVLCCRFSAVQGDALEKLGEEHPDVFKFVRMPPLGNKLYGADKYESLEKYRDDVKKDIHAAVETSRTKETAFIFGSTDVLLAARNSYEKIIQFAYDQVLSVYPRVRVEHLDDDELILRERHTEIERMQVFLTLVRVMLRNVIIEDLGISHTANVDEGDSDEGVIDTACDLIWSLVQSKKLDQHTDDVRLSTAWPTFMAKSKTIGREPARLLDAFVRFIEKTQEKGLRDKMVEAYLELDFPVEKETSFNKPKIVYPQVGSEISNSIRRQERKRNLSVEIPFDPSKAVPSQVLESLLALFEDEYSLTFTCSEKAPVWTDEGGEKKVKGRFEVKDMQSQRHAELDFSMRFSSEDLLASTALKTKIESIITEVIFYHSDDESYDDGHDP